MIEPDTFSKVCLLMQILSCTSWYSPFASLCIHSPVVLMNSGTTGLQHLFFHRDTPFLSNSSQNENSGSNSILSFAGNWYGSQLALLLYFFIVYCLQHGSGREKQTCEPQNPLWRAAHLSARWAGLPALRWILLSLLMAVGGLSCWRNSGMYKDTDC